MPRIAVIADIHHGADHFTKKGAHALGLLADFAAFVAAEKPDLVIELGDRISDLEHDHDIEREREVAAALANLVAPVFHLCGNHDRDYLSVAENEAILGQSLAHQTIDLDGWRIVLWRADSRIRRMGTDGMTGFVLPEADLLWLAGVVREADRPLAVFSHVPVSGHAQTGNYYFERNPSASTYPTGADRARAVLRAAKVPVVCIAGHVHWNTLTTVDGIPHFTLQSLTESFTTHPAPAGAWAMLELSEIIDWQVTGLDPFAATLDTASTARRWIPPLLPFSENPETKPGR